MRPRVTVLSVAALLMVSSAVGAAAQYEYLDGAHWDVTAGRAGVLVIVDATDDPRAQEALRAFKAVWNAMRTDSSLAVLPPVDLSTARPWQACSGARLRRSRLPGHVVVCLDDALATAAVGGPYRVDAHGHTTVGLVKLRSGTLSWSECNLRTAVAHELGHVMGLAHNDAAGFTGGASVMMSGKGPYGHGCPAWFNAHDRAALRALYGGHAAARAAAADPATRNPETAIRPGTP